MKIFYTENTRKLLVKSCFHIVLVFLWIFSGACDSSSQYVKGNGQEITEKRLLESFLEVDIQGNYEVVLVEGDQEMIEITTDENLIGLILTEVDDSKLEIYNTESISGRSDIKIAITYKQLNQIVSGGAGSIKSTSGVNSNNLVVNMKGAGMIDLEVDVDTLAVHLSGAGFISLSGKAKVQDLSISGAGNLDAYELRSNDCKVNLSGIGGAQIFVEDKLHAQISGIGGIKYKGYPKHVKKDVAGLGRIKCEDKKRL